MKHLLPFLACSALLAAPATLSAKITRIVEKTFAVQPGGNFKAATQGGNITIQTADVPEIRIRAKQVIRATTEREADEILGKLALTFEQSGNDVTAEARYEKRGAGSWFGSWPPVNVSFEVIVPRRFNLDLSTSGGDIGVASLHGNVRARTSGGDLKFDRIDGEIDAHTSGGDIHLKESTALAKLGTSGGDIEVDRAGGPISVATSGGNITLNAVAQLVSARTSGGNIRATLTEPPKADTVLSTSGGDVRVRVPKGAGFELDASTSGGSVRAEGLTITIGKGGISRSRLAGVVNGGGPRLKLRTSGGNISVQTE
jgi:hypothetical protein